MTTITEIYISTDVETDGPIPGPHSMLSFGSAAYTADKKLISTFSANLETLPDASAHPKTAEWWATQPEAWEACRKNPEPPSDAMSRYVKWLKSLPGRPVFVAYPAGFDFLFVYWYLMRFVGESPFSHSALDMKSFAMALLKTDYRESGKRNMPKHWFDKLPHTHVALDDAIEQGALFCNMLNENRTHETSERYHKGRKQNAMIDKTLRANLAVGILGVVIAGFSGAALYEFGGEIARPLFAAPRMESVIGLAGENTTVEAEITGFVDPERILIEETTSRLYGNDATSRKYYYAVYDQSRTIGFYAYSDLAPDEFMRRYSKGQAVLHGIWEETPRDIRIKEPMSRVGEQMRELVGRGVAMGRVEDIMQPLTAFARRNPLRIDRRLNLHPARWKLEQAAVIATMALFFIIGLAMVWAAIKRRVQPR